MELKILKEKVGKEAYSEIILFREHGVGGNLFPFYLDTENMIRCVTDKSSDDSLQTWLLSHDGKNLTTLTRIEIY